MKKLTFTLSLLLLNACTPVATENQNSESAFDKYTPESHGFYVEKVLEESCSSDDDCETPMDYLIRSSCPFTSKCLEGRCAVICPNF
jgi:hypothetical protein